MRKVIILGSHLALIVLSASACNGLGGKDRKMDSIHSAIVHWDTAGITEVVVPGTSNSEVIVHAGEQAVSTEHGIEIHKIDVENYKFGDLTCRNMPLTRVLKHISRLYDVKIELEYPDVKLNGTLRPERSLQELLPKLEEMSGLKFKIEDSTIRVIN